MTIPSASTVKTRDKFAVVALPILALAFLAGCALDPVDSKPETGAPDTWNSGAKPSDAVVSDAWWKAFGDPGLDAVVARALDASPDLDASYARVRAARAAAGLADSGFWPTLSGNASWNRQRTTQNQIFSVAGGKTYNTQEVGLAATYEVDLWGNLRNQAHAAESNYRSSHADLAAARLLVAAETTKIWFDLAQAKADRATLADTFASRKESYDLQAAREKAGLIGGDDVARAKLDAAQAKFDLDNSILQIGLLRNALAAAVGETPGASRLPEPSDGVSATVPVVPVSVPSALLKSRPDVASADLKLDAALALEGAARSNFYPNITLSASGGFSSITAAALLNSSSRLWQFGPTLSLPIFTGGANDAALENARARFDADWADYRLTVLTAFRETEDALLTADRLAEQEKLITAVVDAANESYTFARARYEKGLSSNLEVTIAERDALTARRSYIQTHFDRLRASANLARVLGGGWNRDTGIDKSKQDFEDRLETRDKAAEKAKADAAAKPATPDEKKS